MQINRLKKGKSLFGYSFCDRPLSIFCTSTFRCTFCHNSEFRERSVCSTSKSVIAFSAFPDAYTLSFNPGKTALWALVGFLQLLDDLNVAFSDCRAVSGTETSRGTNFLCLPQFLTNPFFSAILLLFSGQVSWLLESVFV